MRIALATLFLLGFIVAANAQSQQPSFEAASIKPVKLLPPGATGFGSVTQDPDMISIKCATLRSLLERAYGLKPFQVSGPDWLDIQCYDVMAKLSAGTTADEIPAMLQQLITERFHMTLRWDTKQETGYALVIDSSGPKLTLSADQSIHDNDQPDKPRSLSMSNTVVAMHGATVAALASFLSDTLAEPVADSTGLKGRYDITLKITLPDLIAARQGPSPSSTDDGGYTPRVVFDAVRDIGLRLDPQKAEVKKLTVVHADRVPAEN